MALRNGAAHLQEQVMSILSQLGADDELVVSEDRSCDRSLDIIDAFEDRRIKVVYAPRPGVVANFENALNHSSGELIFLSDQDDVWHSDKIRIMRLQLVDHDMVVCNCALIGEDNQIHDKLFFELNGSGKGLLNNLIRNSYMGCCMAFRREVLSKALPFPGDIPVHDQWLGLVAELYFRPVFLDKVLVYHRRHSHNASTTSGRSTLPYTRRVSHRFHLVKNLVKRSYA